MSTGSRGTNVKFKESFSYLRDSLYEDSSDGSSVDSNVVNFNLKNANITFEMIEEADSILETDSLDPRSIEFYEQHDNEVDSMNAEYEISIMRFNL
jgi:hypothetical protein